MISEVLFNDLKSIPLPFNTLNVFPAMRLQLGSMLNKIGLCTDMLSQLHILHGGPHCLFFISQHYLFWNIDTFLLLLSIFHWCLSHTLKSRECSLSSFWSRKYSLSSYWPLTFTICILGRYFKGVALLHFNKTSDFHILWETSAFLFTFLWLATNDK